MDYKEIVNFEQREDSPAYDKARFQEAVDAYNAWVRARLGRYPGHLEEPTDEFMVEIDGEQWQVVECWTGDLCTCVLLQKGRDYLMYDKYWGQWWWIQFAVDASDMVSSPPKGFVEVPLVNLQRALARARVFEAWS